MFPGMNAAKMQGMMKKIGISQTPLNVRRVIFEIDDGNLIIDEPSVTRVMMQGQETYQVSGEAHEEESSGFSEEDIAQAIKNIIENYNNLEFNIDLEKFRWENVAEQYLKIYNSIEE